MGSLHPRANAKLDQRLRSFLSQCAACSASLSNALSSLNRFGWVESGDMDVTDIRGEIGSTGSSGSRACAKSQAILRKMGRIRKHTLALGYQASAIAQQQSSHSN
jgi:hypothetical protein